MDYSERRESAKSGSAKNSGTAPETLPRPRYAPTFSAEEEESMELERASMQQEMEEALEALRKWKRDHNW